MFSGLGGLQKLDKNIKHSTYSTRYQVTFQTDVYQYNSKENHNLTLKLICMGIYFINFNLKQVM